MLFACRAPEFVVTVPSDTPNGIVSFEVFVESREEPLTGGHTLVREGETLTIRYQTLLTFRAEIMVNGILNDSTFNSETGYREITHIVRDRTIIEISSRAISQVFTVYFFGEHSDEMPPSSRHDIGENISLPTIAREGFHFLGWRIYSADTAENQDIVASDDYYYYNNNDNGYYDETGNNEDNEDTPTWPADYVFLNTLPFLAHNTRAEGTVRLEAVFRSLVLPTSISIIGGDRELFFRPDGTGRNYQLTYSIFPSSTDYSSLVWESSNPSVVSVDETGFITIYHSETVQIIVRFLEHPEVYDVINITATLINLYSLMQGAGGNGFGISATPSSVATGEEILIRINLLTYFYFEDDFEIVIFNYDSDNIRVYHSFDIETLVKDEMGAYFTFVMVAGGAFIQILGIKDGTPPVLAESIEIEGEEHRVVSNLHDDVSLVVVITPNYASPNAFSIAFSSSNPLIASVCENGIVSINSSGLVTITATLFCFISNLYVDSAIVTFYVFNVFLPEQVRIASTDVNTSGDFVEVNLEVVHNSPIQLSATKTPNDSNAVNYFNVVWTSSNEDRATVSATGLVSFLSHGTVVVTVQITRGETVLATDSLTFRIMTVMTALSLNGYQSQTIAVREDSLDMTFVADAYPLNYALLPAGTQIHWTTGNSAVASISPNGTSVVVSFHSAGTAIVTVHIPWTDFYATITFHVAQIPTRIEFDNYAQIERTVREDAVVNLSASVFGNNPLLPTTNYGVVWTSLNETLATVNENGVVSFLSYGLVTIRARVYDTVLGLTNHYVEITFTAMPLAREISVSSPVTTVREDSENITLTAIVNPLDAIGFSVVWESSDSSVATVSNSGVVSFISHGVVTIRAIISDNILGLGAYSEVELTVMARPQSLSIGGETSRVVRMGDSAMNLKNELVLYPINMMGYDVMFTSSNISVVTINSSTGIATFSTTNYGTSTINIILFDTLIGIANVEVYRVQIVITVAPVATGVEIVDGERNFYIGEISTTLVARTLPLAAIGYDFLWTSSNESVATVDAFGVVHFVSSGNVVITVSINGHMLSANVTLNIRPLSVMPTNIFIGFATTEFREDALDAQLTASSPQTSLINATSYVIWTSLNENVATVGRYTGIVTFLTAGSLTIRATFAFNPAVFDEATFNITPAPTNIQINTGALEIVGGFIHRQNDVGDAPLSHTLFPTGVSTSGLGLSWTSSDETIASVNPLGVVSFNPTTFGYVTITVSVNGLNGAIVSDSVVFRVTTRPLGLTISGEGIVGNHRYISVGQTNIELTAVAYPVGWTVATYEIVWESVNMGVTNSTGHVTTTMFMGVSGSISAFILINNEPTGISQTVSFTVIIPPDGILVANNNHMLRSDDLPVQLIVNISPYGASGDLVFSSSNTNVVSVDSLGLVTIIGGGSAYVTVRLYFNGNWIASGSANFTIVAVPTTLTIESPPSFNFRYGFASNISLGFSASPSDIIENIGMFGVEWRSTNTNVATVSNGIVSPIGIGTALIYLRVFVNGDWLVSNSIEFNIFAAIEDITIVNSSIVARSDSDPFKIELEFVSTSPVIEFVTTFFISSDTTVATVDSNGLVTLHSAGFVEIAITAIDTLTNNALLSESVHIVSTIKPSLTLINNEQSSTTTVVEGTSQFVNFHATTTEGAYIYTYRWDLELGEMVFDNVFTLFTVWESETRLFLTNFAGVEGSNIAYISEEISGDFVLRFINFTAHGTVYLRAETWSLCGEILYSSAYRRFIVQPLPQEIVVNGAVTRNVTVNSTQNLRNLVSVLPVGSVNYHIAFALSSSSSSSVASISESIISFHTAGIVTVNATLSRIVNNPVLARVTDEYGNYVLNNYGNYVYEMTTVEELLFVGNTSLTFNITSPVLIDGETSQTGTATVGDTINLMNSVTLTCGAITNIEFDFRTNASARATVNSNGVITFISAGTVGNVVITVRAYLVTGSGRILMSQATITFTINTSQYCYFTLTDGAITSLSALGREQATIVIPSSVTRIGNTVFANTANLRTVSFASGSQLTSIGNSAFQGSALTSITLPASLTSIGSSAFFMARSLTSIHIPASVNYIGGMAFAMTDSLSTVTFAPGSQLTTISWETFTSSGLTSIALPPSITTIERHAFSATGLTSFSIPPSVTTIGQMAFANTHYLTSITIPASVTVMESHIFSGWNNTQSIYVQGRTSAPSTWNALWRAGGTQARLVWLG